MAAPANTDFTPPGRRHSLTARCARALLAAAGWRVLFDGLPGPQGIVIVYPHTSNWDFILGLAAKWTLDLPLCWVGKESLFRGAVGATLGRLMRRWGGRPVDRFHPRGAVAQLAQLFAASDWCWLALSPEGTRRRADHIRSGFYHLAVQLDLPVVLATIDYSRKEIAATEVVRMSGDRARDLATLARYYADKRGRHPAQASAFAFRDQED